MSFASILNSTRVLGCALLLLSGTWLFSVAAASGPVIPAEVRAGKISAEAWAKVKSSGMREFLVEFHDTGVALKDLDRAAFDQRVVRLRMGKTRALARLAASDFEIRRDFQHLPMNFIRVRDADALIRLLRQAEVKAVRVAPRPVCRRRPAKWWPRWIPEPMTARATTTGMALAWPEQY